MKSLKCKRNTNFIKINSTLINFILGFAFIVTNLHAQENYIPLIGHWSYGSCNDVEVVENIAYMGNGNFFQTYDVTDKLNPAFLGEIKLTSTVEKIVIHNDLALVAIDEPGNRYRSNFLIINIANPENLTLLGRIDEMSSPASILPDSNSVCFMGGGILTFVDISDPANPFVVKTNFDADFGLEEGKLKDNLIYAANSRNGLQIYNVSDPENVVKVGELALGDTTDVDPYSIEIRDNYAFLGVDGAGLVIVDISDPANPVKVASIKSPRPYAYESHIELNGNHVYLADERYGDLYIFDISDVEKPQELYRSERVAQIGSMKIRENHLYIARINNYSDYFTGLQILSIEDPVNPTQASFIATPEALSGFKISEEKNEAYFGGYNVFVLDITDKSNPKTKTVIQTRAQINDFTIIDNYMFTAMDEDGFGIYDITDPDAPQQIGHFNTTQFGSGQFNGNARSVTIKDNYAFVAISYAGLIVLDISDKTNPQLVKRFSEYGGHGLYRNGNDLYVSEFVLGKYIVDISDPINSSIIANPEEFEIPGGLFVQDNYAYIADTTLYVYDISDKSNPIEISSTHTDARGYIFVLDNQAYIFSSDKDSVFIYDVTDPGKPVPVESASLTIDGRIIITADYIYTSARNAGVKIYKNEILTTSIETQASAPSSFSLSQNYPNPFNQSTSINYSIPSHSFVSLKISDIQGNVIKTLINESQSAGTYSINFDASGLAPGFYFFRLQSGNFSQIRKAILIK